MVISTPLEITSTKLDKYSKNQVLGAIAVQEALDDKDTKKHKKITNGLLYAAPIVDSVLFSALNASQTKSLGKTIGSLSKRLAGWGAIFAFVTLASAGIDKLTEKSKTLKTIQKTNPGFKTLADMGLVYAAFGLVNNGFNKIANYIPNNIKEQISKHKEAVMTSLDSSKFAQKTFVPILDNAKAFMSKHAKLSSGIKAAIPSVAGIMILGSIFKGVVFDNIKLQNKITKNYAELQGITKDNTNLPEQN